MADPIGRRYGTHKYRIAGSTKSVEGSLGFLAVGFLAVAGALMFFGMLSSLPASFSILLFSLAFAALGTLIEAVSPAGTDNLTVPVILFLLGLLVT